MLSIIVTIVTLLSCQGELRCLCNYLLQPLCKSAGDRAVM